MGYDGAIYSTINGVGGPDPIAECDNCSRVIKYVFMWSNAYGALLFENKEDHRYQSADDFVGQKSPNLRESQSNLTPIA